MAFVFAGNVHAQKKKRNIQVDSILASVNGDPISMMDLIWESGRDEARLSAIYSGKELYRQVRKLRKRILEDIISKKLIVEDYKKVDFEIPEQYIEDTLDEIAMSFSDGTQEGLAKKAEKSGTSIEKLRRQAREKVIVDMMLNRHYYKNINVTPREIFEYYKKNKEEFSSPPKVELALLFLKNNGRHKDNFAKTVNDIQRDTKSRNEKIFKSLTVLYSEGPNAENGGYLGWIEKDKLRPEFAEVLKKAEPGFISGPVKTEEGVYFIRVADRKKAKDVDFDNVDDDIRKKLESKLRRKAYDNYIKTLRENAIIRYYY